MKSMIQKAGLLLSTAALALVLPLGSAQAEDKVTIAVSIPAATHGWTGGVVYHAEQAEKEMDALARELSRAVGPFATDQFGWAL